MKNEQKENALVVIQDWCKRNNLKAVSKYKPMLEVYRRTMVFHKGNANDVKTLAFHSEVANVNDLINVKNDTLGQMNWYSLTPKGIEIINDLIKENIWSDYMNALIFSNQML